MLTEHQLPSQRHPQGVWKPSSQGTPGDGPQKSPFAERALPRWREQTQRMEILETSVGALCRPGKPRSGRPGRAEPRWKAGLSHCPSSPGTACPSAAPVGTQGCIVRDVQFSDVRWDFSGFSTSTKAFQAASKTSGLQIRTDLCAQLTPSSPCTRTEPPALDTEPAAPFLPPKSKAER